MGIWQSGKVLPIDELKKTSDGLLMGTLKGTCDGLVEGNEYTFRIKAINKGGPSTPSDPSDSMIAKHRYCKTDFKYSWIF